MAFALAGSVITQTGTDTSLAGLNGISGVTRTQFSVASQGGYSVYHLAGRQLVVNGSLTYNPNTDVLSMENDSISPNITVGSGGSGNSKQVSNGAIVKNYQTLTLPDLKNRGFLNSPKPSHGRSPILGTTPEPFQSDKIISVYEVSSIYLLTFCIQMSALFYRFPKPKDPDESLDYEFDWTTFIGDDKIATHSISATDANLVTSKIDSSNKKVIFRISGGVAGIPALIENTVNTSSGQVIQRTAIIRIVPR